MNQERANDSAFDKQELLEELDEDREFLEESLEIFDKDAFVLVARIRDALGLNQAEVVHVSAHTLKSMVGNFFAQPAFDSALRMENAGRNGDLQSCKDELPALEFEINRLSTELHKLMKEV